MLEAIPGDPCQQRIGRTATPEAIELCHQELSLDEPLPVRYANWVGGILQGDFGESYSNGISVRTTLAQVAPVTLQLVLLVLSLVIAIPLGVLAAYRYRRAGWNTFVRWSCLSSRLQWPISRSISELWHRDVCHLA